jgi:hypothetical protein
MTDEPKNTKWTILLQAAERFGFPVSLVMVLLLGIAIVGKFIALDIIKPATVSHLELIAQLKSAVAQQASESEKQTDILQQQADILKALKNEQEQTTESVEDLTKELREGRED